MIDSFRNEYRFLSNFAPVRVKYNNLIFPSVEHAYVASKTTDELIQRQIATMSTAGAAKKFGKTIVRRPDFLDIRIDIMRNLLEQKFSDGYYRLLLLKTGSEELVECNNWHDNFFGSCICKNCKNEGENNLGKLLMEIREKIRKEYFDEVAETD